MSYNIIGIILGVYTFFLIGLFHPIVIKSEYFFGTKVWPIFLVIGVGLCVVSFFVQSTMASAMLSIAGIVFLWSIKELFEQKERVKKGWYPKREKN